MRPGGPLLEGSGIDLQLVRWKRIEERLDSGESYERQCVDRFFIKHSLAIFVIATVCCLSFAVYFTNSFKPNVFGTWIMVHGEARANQRGGGLAAKGLLMQSRRHV